MSNTNPPPPATKKMHIFRQCMVEGIPRDEVAQQHKLLRPTVNRYIREVERWLAVQVVILESLMVGHLHLDRLEHQWHELMSAWYRSKQDQVTTKVSTDKQGNQRAEQTRRRSQGEARYLEQARRVLTDIRDLLGITDLSTYEELLRDDSPLTLDQRMALLDRLVQEICHSKPANTNVPADRRGTDADDSPARDQPADAA